MKIIGHRGAKGLAPENTLASIEKAIEVGADEVEIDLRVTKDTQVILCHDPFILNSAGEQVLIIEHTFDELLAIKPDMVLFKTVVEQVNHRVPLLVEIKPKVELAPIIALFQHFLTHGYSNKDFVIGSFDQQILRNMHKTFPALEMVVIESFLSVRAVWRARQVGAKRFNMNYRFLWFGFIRSMRKRGYELYPYTLNDPVKFKKWQKYGLAGVITDRPDLFR